MGLPPRCRFASLGHSPPVAHPPPADPPTDQADFILAPGIWPLPVVRPFAPSSATENASDGQISSIISSRLASPAPVTQSSVPEETPRLAVGTRSDAVVIAVAGESDFRHPSACACERTSSFSTTNDGCAVCGLMSGSAAIYPLERLSASIRTIRATPGGGGGCFTSQSHWLPESDPP